jgi:hypothetical protein
MVLTPNDLFSWNNKYSKHKDILLCYIHCMARCSLSDCAHQLTLCMLVFSSREGVVFLVLSLSFHLTETHVLSPPESEAN